MKITSGKFSGISLFSPKGKTARPTLSKTRQAVFNMLRAVVPGSTCVDFFAGTGAFGFEALSNGAEKAVFVENRYKGIIYKNAKKLDLNSSDYYIIPDDYRKSFSILEKNRIKADIVFADPPYNKGFVRNFLKLLGKSDILNDNGTVIIEVHRDEMVKIEESPDFKALKQKKYGDTYIVIMTKNKGE